MMYRARESRAVSAWISDDRGKHTHGGETVCPGFHRYKGFSGCPAWAAGKPCTYCFLETTHRYDRQLSRGVAWGRPLADCEDCHRQEDDGSCRVSECSIPIDVSRARAAVQRWLENPFAPQVLNAGETADSLGFPPEDNPHVGMLLDLFGSAVTNPHGHKVLFVSKAGPEATKAHLEGQEPSENVILSWSAGNLDETSEAYWAGSVDRVVAAQRAAGDGWRVRLRLDPLAWTGECIADFADGLMQVGGRAAEIVTLGTLRHRGGRVKEPEVNRGSIYASAIAGLRAGGYEGPVGLCKETPEVYDRLRREFPDQLPERPVCNCITPC